MKLFISILLMLTTGISQAKELSVGWELWYPYQYRNKEQKLIGLDFDVFNKIIEHAGLSVNYTELPWKRHVHYIKTGDMDVAMGSSMTKEREAFAHFSTPYRVEKVNLFVLKGKSKSIQLDNLSSLINSDYMIGIESGYYYGEYFLTLNKLSEFQSHISEVIDLEDNVKLLLKGHLDGILVDPVSMNAFVKKYQLEGKFEQHNMPVYQDDIYLMLSKKSVSIDTVILINKSIETLKNNGSLEEIINKWTKTQ